MLGYQVAFCWRNTAIYAGLFLFGLLFGLARDRGARWLGWLKKPLAVWAFVLFLLPMAVDGLTHTFGLREMGDNVNMDMWYGWLLNQGSQVLSANWWLRIITGALAALGAVWFAYPRMQRAVEQAEALRRRYQRGAGEQTQATAPVLRPGGDA